MCYKDEVQRKNAEKLQKKFDEDNVPEFIRRYFINITSKAAAVNYWIAIKDLLLWILEKKRIDKNISDIRLEDFFKIEPEDITLYLQQKENEGISPTTLETRKYILRGFWNYLIRQRGSDIRPDFFKAVAYKGISSGDNLIRKLPSDEQLKSMEEKIKNKRDEYVRVRNLCVLRVLKGTALRESELAGLDISDLFLDKTMTYVKILGKGKYRERESRIVYLTGDAVNAIREWIEIRDSLDNIIDKDAVFLNKNGKRFNEDNIQAMFKKYGDGVTPHMIRHWAATMFASKGNIALAQQQCGHRSQNTTINNYVNGVYGMKEILENM